MRNGLIVAAVQVALVLSIGAKLLADRATLPRVWVKTVPFDPNLFIRGRYISMAVEVEPQNFSSGFVYGAVRLSVENGKLVAHPTDDGNVMVMLTNGRARLNEPLAFFIPDGVPDPSRRPPGEELWVEVTVPRKGPPRPIQLGVRKNGVLTPLDLN